MNLALLDDLMTGTDSVRYSLFPVTQRGFLHLIKSKI
jgi:hypothetical protein